jgi:O-antigen/teichoic acid export membrane protein
MTAARDASTPQPVTGSRIAGNSGWNLLAFAMGVAVNLVTVPIVVKRIGMHEFGVAGLIVALVAPFLLIGTVLGQAAAQGLALHRAAAERAHARKTVAAVLGLLAICVPAGMVMLAGLAPSVAGALFGDDARPSAAELRRIFAIAALGWAAQQVSTVLQGVHVGVEAYRRIATVNAVSALIGGILIVTIVDRAPSAIGYVAALSAGYWATLVLWSISTCYDVRWCLSRPRFGRAQLRSVVSFSGWQIAAQLTATLAAQADRYLLGLFARAQSIGFYNVAQRLEEVAYVGVLKAGEVLFPFFASTAHDEPARVANRYFRACWLLNLVAAAALAPLLPWAQDILRLWIDAPSAAQSADVLRVLAAGGLVGCASNVFAFFALGTGRTRHLALLSVTTAAVSIAASMLLLPRFGLAAAGVGALAGMLVQFAVVVALTRRIFGQHARAGRVLHASVTPATTGLAIAAGVATLPLPSPDSWHALIAWLAITAGLVAVTIIAVAAATAVGRASLADLRDLARRASRSARFSRGDVGSG